MRPVPVQAAPCAQVKELSSSWQLREDPQDSWTRNLPQLQPQTVLHAALPVSKARNNPRKQHPKTHNHNPVPHNHNQQKQLIPQSKPKNLPGMTTHEHPLLLLPRLKHNLSRKPQLLPHSLPHLAEANPRISATLCRQSLHLWSLGLRLLTPTADAMS